MPATEETYRRQPSLHIIFALSSLAMMLSMVWMILADHLRPWKVVQREFHDVETVKLRKAEAQKQEEQRAKYQSDLEAVRREIKEAQETEARNTREIRAQQARIEHARGRFDKADTARKFKKAELDSQRSLYDGMI